MYQKKYKCHEIFLLLCNQLNFRTITSVNIYLLLKPEGLVGNKIMLYFHLV